MGGNGGGICGETNWKMVKTREVNFGQKIRRYSGLQGKY